jgi:hypothetical protein
MFKDFKALQFCQEIMGMNSGVVSSGTIYQIVHDT